MKAKKIILTVLIGLLLVPIGLLLGELVELEQTTSRLLDQKALVYSPAVTLGNPLKQRNCIDIALSQLMSDKTKKKEFVSQLIAQLSDRASHELSESVFVGQLNRAIRSSRQLMREFHSITGINLNKQPIRELRQHELSPVVEFLLDQFGQTFLMGMSDQLDGWAWQFKQELLQLQFSPRLRRLSDQSSVRETMNDYQVSEDLAIIMVNHDLTDTLLAHHMLYQGVTVPVAQLMRQYGTDRLNSVQQHVLNALEQEKQERRALMQRLLYFAAGLIVLLLVAALIGAYRIAIGGGTLLAVGSLISALLIPTFLTGLVGTVVRLHALEAVCPLYHDVIFQLRTYSLWELMQHLRESELPFNTGLLVVLGWSTIGVATLKLIGISTVLTQPETISRGWNRWLRKVGILTGIELILLAILSYSLIQQASSYQPISSGILSVEMSTFWAYRPGAWLLGSYLLVSLVISIIMQRWQKQLFSTPISSPKNNNKGKSL